MYRIMWPIKELSFCHKFLFYNPYIFAVWWCKPLIFQTIIIWSKRIYSLKYQRSPIYTYIEIGIRKSEFVAKTQFLYFYHTVLTFHAPASDSETFKMSCHWQVSLWKCVVPLKRGAWTRFTPTDFCI